ncbi:MAG: hypothetical protein JXQ97_14305 [Natronospirillum sp.]
MTMTQALGALSTTPSLHIKKQDQNEQKGPSFAAIAESIKPTAAKLNGSDTKLPSVQTLTTSLYGPSVSSSQPLEKADHAHAEKSAAQQLREYMEMSPAERIRAGMLNEMGLTEEDLENLPPEEQLAIELKIAQRIKDTLGADSTLLSDKANSLSFTQWNDIL